MKPPSSVAASAAASEAVPPPTPERTTSPSSAAAAASEAISPPAPPDGCGGGDESGGGTSLRSPTADVPFPDPRLRDPTALETVEWWAEFTSIHGVYYMFERGHFQPWKQRAWIIVVLVATGALLWALVAECQEFAKFTVNTATKTVIPTSLPFPRVTICNAKGGVSATRQDATGIAEPRNEEELEAIAQPLEEFVLYTQFNGKVYDGEGELASAWTPVVTPLGRCFSFTSDEDVFVPGTAAGLAVHAWLDQASYPEATSWAGIRVFVTPRSNDNAPVVSGQTSGGVLVSPGDVSFIALTMRDIRREEDEPWANCAPVDDSIEQCRAECIATATRRNCGCRYIGDGNDPSLDFCNSTHLDCEWSLRIQDLDLCQACSTPQCQERRFGTRYSAGRVSKKAAESAAAARGASVEELYDNFVHVHVNFDSIRYEQTTETKTTSVSQLFSNLGGSMGFFMGISLISVVELFTELLGSRLLPRLGGKRLLYGVGQKELD